MSLQIANMSRENLICYSKSHVTFIRALVLLVSNGLENSLTSMILVASQMIPVMLIRIFSIENELDCHLFGLNLLCT